ncbi:MAG TPA: HYR domain-containing protein [Bacteroidetes bacterium]|nr:HYR domain-containing protein [Bacteroidota bacterium]
MRPITYCTAILFFLSIFFQQNILAQAEINPNVPRCAFDEINESLRQNDPQLEQELRDYVNQAIPSFAVENRSAAEPLLTVAVVVHVIHSGEPVGQGSNISDERIEGQIDVLNEDYSSLNKKFYDTPAQWMGLAGTPNIQFLLATTDPDGNPTNGITRHNIPITGSSWNSNNINSEIKPATNWDPTRYMNVYVVSIPGTTAAGGVVGYSNYPTPSQTGSASDGPVVDFNWIGGHGSPASGIRALSHETGHYLGLPHTFNGSSCSSDDNIADTPNIDNATSQYATLDCDADFPQGPMSCGNEHLYVNYMDYVTENCYTSFTQGQVNVMRAVLQGGSSGFDYGSRQSLLTNAPSLTDIPVADAGITRLTAPTVTNCTADVLVPEVTLRNFGSDDLTQVSINYKVNNGAVSSYIWQGNLIPGELTNVELPAFTPPDGIYEMNFYTTNPNGQTDDRASNDLLQETLLTYFAFDPPMIEAAENETAFPTSKGTFPFNVNNDTFEWEMTTEVSSYGLGNESFVFNNRAGTLFANPIGTLDALITRHFDFSEVSDAALYFDVAYAPYNSLQSDTLMVLVATDCSQDFNQALYKRGGTDLATAPAVQTLFTPTAAQWRTDGIDLSSYDGMSDVTIAFLNISNWGNRLFLDNIRVGVNCAALAPEWTVLPNACDTPPTGICSGTATLNVPVSNGGLTYLWENWPPEHNQPTIYNLCPGGVAVTVTDAFGCQLLAENEVPQATPPELSAAATIETAYNAMDASATVNVTSGAAPFTYHWSNGTTETSSNPSSTLSGLSEGVYSVEVEDALACIAQQEVVVTSVCTAFDVAFSITDVPCFGGANGSSLAMPSNGTPPFEYAWSNGNSSQLNSSLAAGEYYLTLTDANQCPVVDTATVSQPEQFLVNITAMGESAFNAENGTASATVFGGTPDYSFLWSNGETTETISGLAPGTYTVTVEDGMGCSTFGTAFISAFTCEDFQSVISWENVTCFGFANGTAVVEVSGETQPVTYDWSNGQSGQMIENLPAGDYSVTVMDAVGCSAELTANVLQPDSLFAQVSATNITAMGANDGTATAAGMGGTPAYGYEWSNGETTAMITGLAPGTYIVTVTDFNGCEAVNSAEVQGLNCSLQVEIESSDASCPNVADGSAAIASVSGAAMPLEYQWSNGSVEMVAVNLLPATYNVLVTDANGCAVNTSVEIGSSDDVPPTLQLLDFIEIELIGNSATFEPSSADNGSSDNCSLVSFSAPQTNFDCSDIGQNPVMVTGTDASGNSSNTMVTVVVVDNTPPTIACPDNIAEQSCDAISYDLPMAEDICSTPELELINGLESGSFFPAGTTEVTWQATDVSGNTSSCTFEVTVDYDLDADFIISQPSCYGVDDGSVDVFITGGLAPYQTIWSHGGGPSNLPPGEYTLDITDSNGCTLEASFTMEAPPVFEVEVFEIVHAMGGSPTGSITLDITGGNAPFDFAWSANGNAVPDFDPSQAPPGLYGLVVTDDIGCTASIDSILVDNLNSVFSKELNQKISIFPNPTSGNVFLELDASLSGNLEITVLDVSGKKCFYKNLASLNGKEELALGALPSGVYWLRLILGDKLAWKKLVVM